MILLTVPAMYIYMYVCSLTVIRSPYLSYTNKYYTSSEIKMVSFTDCRLVHVVFGAFGAVCVFVL